MRPLPVAVDIREVGPRDGLQPERPVSVDDRIRLVHALQAAGLRHIEVAAFVSPARVPAMAGAAEVVAGIDRRPDTTYAALVPNLRGAELALAAGVDELTVTVSASEGYNRRNVAMSVDDSVEVIGAICALAGAIPVDAVVSCAFGSPYEGDLAAVAVAGLGGRLLDGGCRGLTWADTTGMASPARVDALLDARSPADAGPMGAGLHLHDTRGTAMVNAYAGLQRGVTRFDTAVGGLGGSPFAAGATGNLATEELVAVLDDLGVVTGIDVDAVVEVAALAPDLVGHRVPSRVAEAGPRSRPPRGP